MIFVDSNVPMYLVGADHPNKIEARRLLDRCVLEGSSLITDAEVYQEILHRYVAINRRDAIAPAFALLDAITDEVAAIGYEDVAQARNLILANVSISARDAIHVSVMRRLGCIKVLTFDQRLGQVPGLELVS
jgi:predicted nucleic acid-binding protein